MLAHGHRCTDVGDAATELHALFVPGDRQHQAVDHGEGAVRAAVGRAGALGLLAGEVLAAVVLRRDVDGVELGVEPALCDARQVHVAVDRPRAHVKALVEDAARGVRVRVDDQRVMVQAPCGRPQLGVVASGCGGDFLREQGGGENERCESGEHGVPGFWLGEGERTRTKPLPGALAVAKSASARRDRRVAASGRRPTTNGALAVSGRQGAWLLHAPNP